jgi:hypothetical protein
LNTQKNKREQGEREKERETETETERQKREDKGAKSTLKFHPKFIIWNLSSILVG